MGKFWDVWWNWGKVGVWGKSGGPDLIEMSSTILPSPSQINFTFPKARRPVYQKFPHKLVQFHSCFFYIY
jgi:hypothetical protein